MNYKLAKQLKEAGFPQRRGCSACLTGYAWDSRIDKLNIDEQITTEDKWTSNPTLSELIDACGEGLISMVKLPHAWLVEGYKNKEAIVIENELLEEAVAELWLKINK